MTELQYQAECWRWHYNAFPTERGLLCRIKNELDNHPRKTQKDRILQLAENKATGVRSGVWDFLYMIYPTIWIECKMGKNDLTPEQKEFRVIGEILGHEFYVAYDILPNFQKIIYEIRQTG